MYFLRSSICAGGFAAALACGCGGSSSSQDPSPQGPGAPSASPDTEGSNVPSAGDTATPPSQLPQAEPVASTPAGGVPNCSTVELAGEAEGWIAFDADDDDFNRDIYRVRPNGAELQRLTDDAAIDQQPAVSPDGSRLAFTSDRSGKPQIYLLKLASEQVTQVTQRAGGADQASFSRDGRLLAFHSGSSVYTISIDGADERFVGAGIGDFNAYFWPSFSADGTELVVDRNNEINAIQIQTGQSRYIVSNTTTTIKSPVVSPSGTAVAYHVYCDMGGLSVWTTPFSAATEACKGRRVTPVSDGGVDSQRPSWGPGNLLAYERVNKGTNVAKLALISRAEGELHCVLTPGAADSRNPSWWSPTP